ncbi:hypothetical protein BAE44_0014564 [Dichanthelium oligosanthes]|uniref:Transcription repressor n=1 Tax=Dichanthelium oligosanthes TaxID=888268 RepID=A0A1E5VH88_9POAL|nr:hypothetical protein BAE44_0014564 [Dichanthelium oligosanthes]
MRWGLRSSKQQQREAPQPLERERQQESKGKSKAILSSFSPLAWLSKLTAKNGAAMAAARPGHGTSAAKSNAQAATAFPSCFHKPTSPSPASASRSSQADSSSPSAAEAADDIVPRRDDTGATAAEIAPRRRSVGNDDTGSEFAVARQLYRRRHYSLGGDHDLPPLIGHLSASPKAPPTLAPVRTLTPVLPPLPSDTDEEKRPRSRRRRHRRVVSGRRSFSSAKAPGGARLSSPAVRVRSPRPSSAAAAAVSELERFAVVRRTRDPQREFRASMVEMIASKRMVGRPEELETLLACYLSLNADEHHDCIVKVFRQVWFELNNTNTSRAAATATAAPPQRA